LDDSFTRALLHRLRRANLMLKGAQNIQPRATRLAWALATFKDRGGRVLIPGHYDRVRRPTAEEHHLLNPDLSALAASMDIAVVRAELGFSTAPEPLYRFSVNA